MVKKPKPYEPRVSSGVGRVIDEGDGRASVEVPVAELLYPGERANTEIVLDRDAGVARYSTFVEPAPGLRMKLLRVAYRVKRFLHLTAGGRPHLTVDVLEDVRCRVEDPDA